MLQRESLTNVRLQWNVRNVTGVVRWWVNIQLDLAALLSKLVAVLLSKSVGRPVPLIWIIVRPGPTVLAVGAGGDCLDIFLSSFAW